MDLSDFIAVTLDQIMDGVTKASKAHRDSGRRSFINPMDGQQGDTFDSIPISEVRFDVAVTVESSKSKSRTGGINIKVLEARLGGEGGEKFVGESRVSFTVPVCLPTTKLT